MDKNEKAALDTYRQERKERIAKQAKQANKKSSSHDGAKAILGKIAKCVVAVVLVVAILGASLNFFGVPQRMINAIEIDGKTYSMSELTLYYMQMYNNTYSYASSYESNYGEGYGKMLTGYDINRSPADQTTKDDDGNEITWDEYFLDQAIEYMATVKRYYGAAIDAGIEMTEKAQADIDAAIESLDKNSGSYSLSRFLSLYFGKGVTEKLYKDVLTEQQMVSLYQESRQEDLKGKYSETDVNELYAKDKTAYDVVSFRWFTIDIKSKAEVTSTIGEDESVVTSTTFAEESQAQAFIEKVKSEKNYSEDTFKKVVLEFVDKESQDYETYKQDQATLIQKISKDKIETNVNKDAAKWLYETDENGNYIRQPGDMNYYVSDDEKSVYIFYATGIPYQDETVPASVRHILVKFPDETTTKKEDVSGESVSGEAEKATVSDKIKDECKSEAASILDSYNDYIKENASGKADEEYFGELASKLTDDTASAGAGGLIEELANDGSYVPAFEDWVFSEGEFEGEERIPGSTGIIETEYGYHVMYYVGGHENPVWYDTILNDLITEDWEAEQTEFEKQFGEDAIVRKEMVEGWVKKAAVKTINTNSGF